MGAMRQILGLTLLLTGILPLELQAAEIRALQHRIRDAGMEREFEIAVDEIHVVTKDRAQFTERIPTRASAESVRQFAIQRQRQTGDEVELVLYEKGAPRNLYTRRILTKKVLAQLDEGVDAPAIARAANADYLGPQEYAPGCHLFAVAEIGGALALAETLRGMPGVISADPLLARQQRKRGDKNGPPDDFKSIHQLEMERYRLEPRIPTEPGPAPPPGAVGPRAEGLLPLTHKVFGWFPYWQGTGYTNYRYSTLSTIGYFSYEVNSTNGAYDSIYSWNTTGLIPMAQSNGVKVVLTATLFGNTACRRFLTNATARQNFINTIVGVVSNRGGNGVNIDFESMTDTNLRPVLTLFLSNLATRVRADLPGSEVSVALPAVDWNGIFDVAAYNSFLDYAIIMGYDYYWSTAPQAGPVSPLKASSLFGAWCVERSINDYLAAGIQPGKLLVAVPYYGYEWPTVSLALKANTTGSGTARTYPVAVSRAATYGRIWDTNSLTPYYLINTGSFAQGWYDDTNSLALKFDMVKTKGIAGVGIWALGYDGSSTDLWNLLERTFVGASASFPDDPFFSQQWHLRNTGQNGGTPGIDVNITNVWETYRGSNIMIAIVDDGLQTAHTDLVQNVNTVIDWDFNGNDNNPNPNLAEDFHGTACAGVAAARGNNGRGVVGAAYEATLVGLRLIGGPATDQDEANAMLHSNNLIFVKSNSWGPDDDGQTLAGPGALTAAALRHSVTNGRGGKGTILVWAAGNGADNLDNANKDGYGNSIYTIGIGAISDQGLKASYSEPGACLVVSAPSSSFNPNRQGITTTDLMGNNGYNYAGAPGEITNRDYTATFGGTSSSCPLAAGIIALMLQANPNLGWRDVQEILIRSARRINTNDADWATNGAGLRFNHKYGAGMIDARAAVTMALTWTNLGPQVSFAAAQSNLSLSIPDNVTTGVTRTFTLSNVNLRVEHALLQVNITHARRGDLDIRLISPNNTTSVLAELHNDTGANYAPWTFMTVRNWGEMAAGTWTVRVSDRRAANVGTLNSLRLELFGTSTASNSPPILNPIGNKGVTVSNTLSFAVTATDPDGDPITLTVSNKPAAATFSATGGNGTFTWSNAAPAGIYTTRFYAVATGGSDSETVIITVSNAPPGGAPPNVWINEFHYDNASTDINEGFEVAGAAGVSLGNFAIILYDGLNGNMYGSNALSGTIDNEGCGYGALWFPIPNIQNGAPDGFALVRNGTQVVQFLSYEGGFTAANGPAAGMVSADVGVSQSGSQAAGRTLQLRGSGTNYAAFAWAGPTNSSEGALNAGQSISSCGGQPPVLAPIGSKTVTISNLLQFAVTATDVDGHAITLTVSNKPATAVFSTTNGNGLFTWTNPAPVGVYTTRFFATDVDGTASEAVTITVAAASSTGGVAGVWINEIHYDNTGADVDEGVEVAGAAGTALTNYSLVFYDGGAGTAYKTLALSGSIDNEGCAYGAVWFSYAGMQNGAPDGVALVRGGTSVVQFLSYEGVFTAAGGPAAGMTSTDIGVFEAGTEPVDRSLQLRGIGNAYNHFSWSGPTNVASRGTLNVGQTISGCGGSTGGPPPSARFTITNVYATEASGTISIPVTLSAPASCTVRVSVAGTATYNADYTLATQLVFTTAATQKFFGVSITDDGLAEPAETITLTLANLAGATTGSPSVATIDLRDNDGVTIMAANLASQTGACSSVYGDAAARIFQGLKPDVVAIQEFVVTNAGGHAAYVAAAFGTNYQYWVEPETNSCGIPNGVISRYPILASGEWADTVPGAGYRDFVWATIDLPGLRNLHVISVHFASLAGPAARENEARLLTNYIRQANFPPDDFVVIAGDLNTTSRTDKVLQILSNYVVDAKQPADQLGNKKTNSSRNEDLDYVLPEPELDALHLPLTINGITFSNGMVFDSRLWADPPAPILTNDSGTAGVQHMAVMKLFALPPAGGEQVWINELHYDNAGTDTGEGVEVAGTAGTALTNYSLVHYRTTGTVVSTTSLSGTIDDEGCGLGAVWFAFTLQNDRSAVALVKGGSNVIQFLSYEGAVTGIAGVANGMVSTDIGVSEEPPSAVGHSLQLVGAGATYHQFAWAGPTNASPGTLNAAQNIIPCVPGRPPVWLPIGNKSVNVSNTLVFTVTAQPTEGDPITLTVSNKPAGAVFSASGGDGTFTWSNAAPAGVYTTRFWAADNDGATSQTVIIRVLNPPPGGIGTLWINEVHFDNTGTDTNEGIEVAGKAGIVLTNYAIYSYEGSSGKVDGTNQLSGTVAFESCGFGAVWFGYPPNGLENDQSGLALVLRGTQVVHFISYGGSFTASNGPAAGMTAMNIANTGSIAQGQSYQLIGSGTNYPQFSWTGPVNSSTGSLNAGQTISPCAGDGPGPFRFGPQGGSPPELEPIGNKYILLNDDLYFGVFANEFDGDDVTLSVSNLPPGAQFEANGPNGQFSWIAAGPAGVYTTTFYAVDVDGMAQESVVITVDVWVPPAGALAYYSFDAGGGFTSNAYYVAPHVQASEIIVANDSLFGDENGNPGYAARGGDWTAGTNYFEISLVVTDGYAAAVNAVQFDDRRASQGPTLWHLRASHDGFATNLLAGSTHSAFTENSGPVALPVLTGTNTFRLYASGATLVGATWRIDNLLLLGVVLPAGHDGDNDGMPDIWEIATFGDADMAGHGTDFDEDHFIDEHEFRAGTDPKDDTSFLRALAVSKDPSGSVVIHWASESNRVYGVDRATNVMDGFINIASNIPATPHVNIYTDTTATSAVLNLYRIQLE